MTVEYTLKMRDDACGEETVSIVAASTSEAREQVAEECEDWVSEGEWGDAGAAVDVRWTLIDEDDNEVDEGSVLVEIEPDHDALILAAGGDIDCDHEWTSEGEGGLKENPGVWSTGGTHMLFASHCRLCGLHRMEHKVGCQRDPGERDTVEYTQPERCGDEES